MGGAAKVENHPFTFIDSNLNRNALNTTKTPIKSVYFKGGAVYFDLSFLVGKAYSVTMWTSIRKKLSGG